MSDRAWSWCACTPKYSERCPFCSERALARGDGLVHYECGHWHIDCLLHYLTQEKSVAPKEPVLAFDGMWMCPFCSALTLSDPCFSCKTPKP